MTHRNNWAQSPHCIATVALYCLSYFLPVDSSAPDPFQFENEFITTIAEDGAHVGWKVGRSCENCSRGVYATRRYAAGDVIGRIALDKCVDLGDREEYLTAFLFKVLYDPDVNATFGDYLKTLPPPDQTHCYLSLTMEQADMLQAPPYKSIIAGYYTYVDSIIQDLASRANEYGIDFIPSPQLVLYYMALVTTRAFDFYAGTVGPGNEVRTYMCPLLDLLNNDVPGSAHRVQQSDGKIAVVAQKDIEAGEELTWSYHLGTLHRPDMQLLVYGFLEEKENPYLSGIDLPDFDASDAFRPSPDSDNMANYTRSEAAAELERVRGILDNLPTTEQEDLSLLESGKYSGEYYTELIVKWRVLRKRALRQRTEALQKMLDEL